MASSSHGVIPTFLSTGRGSAIVFLLLLLIPIIQHLEDFKWAQTPSLIIEQEKSKELASDAFNSYKLNAPLFEAVKNSDLELVQSLLEGGIDANKKVRNRKTESETSEAKISFYNVNCEDPQGITPLIEATLLGNNEMIQLLLIHGAKAQPAPGFRHTPLRAACLTANLDLISLLLEKGADPNAQSEGGRTPLMGACYLRPQYDNDPNRMKLSFDAVQLMMSDTRTDAAIRNEFGESAMDLCRGRGYKRSVIILRQRLRKGNTMLQSAVGER